MITDHLVRPGPVEAILIELAPDPNASAPFDSITRKAIQRRLDTRPSEALGIERSQPRF